VATLDVSDIPICGEFSDRFDVISRAETITEFGRSTVTQVTATALGTIYPTGDNSLVRQGDYEMGRKTLTCVTPYRLKQAAPGYQPDLVLYRGNQYLVSSVEDYSQYGAGFVVAILSSTLAQDIPPQ
jgi:hypothetical protein